MRRHLEPHRYLVEFDSNKLAHVFCDLLVVGSGVAGLSAAVEASKHCNVLVLSKDSAAESNTLHAQGGIAVALGEDDSPEYHAADTIATGIRLADEEVVRSVVSDAPRRIRQLIEWGAKFDSEDGHLVFGKEGGHSRARVIRANGDATGAEVERALLAKVRSIANVTIREHAYLIDLLTLDGRCHGALISEPARGMTLVWAQATILATGGAGRLFREPTHPHVATGDGIAIAYRAGAAVRDMEFVQFHPTTLYIAGASRALISETVRGEGGILRNTYGERFMPNYHPDAELAPRDVVSRSIVSEMRRTQSTCVYIDLTHLPKEKVRRRFPKIGELCADFDLDITEDLIPVRPSAHYMIGGVVVDQEGRTELEGLYACGEAASTGLHGANRLGSNSLLEGLVYGCRAGDAAGSAAAKVGRRPACLPIKSEERKRPGHIDVDDMQNSLRSLVWRNLGIERSQPYLTHCEQTINFWCSYVLTKEFKRPRGWELQNLLTLAKLITHAASKREETRGVHHRTDFPERDDVNWLKHVVIRNETSAAR